MFYKFKNNWGFRLILILILLGLLTTIIAFIHLSKQRGLLILISFIFFFITFKKLKYGLFSIAFLTPLLLRSPELLGTANYSIAELILLAILSAWILTLLLNKQISIKRTKIDIPLLIFLLLTALALIPVLLNFSFPIDYSSSAGNMYPFKVLLNTFEFVLLYFFITNNLQKEDIKKIITLSLISLSIVLIYGLYQHFILKLVEISSTLIHPNFLGMYLVLFIPLVIFLSLKHKYPKNLLCLLILVLSVLCLFYSGSRGAVLGLVFAFIIIHLCCQKTIKHKYLAVLIIMLIIPSLFFSIIYSGKLMEKLNPYDLNRYDWHFTHKGECDKNNSTAKCRIFMKIRYSDLDRLAMIRDSLILLGKNPLGIGLGTIRSKEITPFFHHTHNLYLQIALERGIHCLIAFIWLLYMFFKNSICCKVKDKHLKIIRLGLITGIITVLIHGMFDYPFYSQRITILFWFAVGIVMVINNVKNIDSSIKRRKKH